jgi:hypothetical protein
MQITLHLHNNGAALRRPQETPEVVDAHRRDMVEILLMAIQAKVLLNNSSTNRARW